MMLRLALEDHGTYAVVQARGELDVSTSGMLLQAVQNAYAGEHTIVLADLTHIAFADSSGLSALVRCHRSAHEQGRSFAVVCPSDQIRRLVEMLGLDTTLVLADSAEDALARLGGASGSP